MEYRTFRSTLSSVQQPIQGLARTVFHALARLGSGCEGYVSKVFSRVFGSEISARVPGDFRGFVRANLRIAVLSQQRFFVSRGGHVSCENRGLAHAISWILRARLPGLASSVLWLVHWLRFVRVFRTTEFERCATSKRTSESRIFDALIRLVQSIAYIILGLRSYSKMYPQNPASARSY